MAYIEINLPAGNWNYPTSNPAPLDRDTGVNGDILRHLFNDTTEEFIILVPAFELPSNLDGAGTVYFYIYGYAKTAAADKNVVFKIYYSARGIGENWDNAYASKSSGAKACDAQQDELDRHSFSETVANLAWATNDLVRLKLSRDAGHASDTLVGDYGVCNLKIRIPVT